MNQGSQPPYDSGSNSYGSGTHPSNSSSFSNTPAGPDDPTYVRPPVNPYNSSYYPTVPPPPPQPPRSRPFSIQVLLLGGLALLVIIAAIYFGLQAVSQNTRDAQLRATVTAIAQGQATTQANATAAASHYPFSTKVALDDPMYDNSHGNQWFEGSTSLGGNCHFINGAYHVVQTRVGFFSYCLSQKSTFSDFTYEVKMTFIKGSDGGIVFRANQKTSSFYYLVISQDGRYFFFAYDGSKFHSLISGSITQAISGFYTGPTQANLIGVTAHGKTLDLYANGQKYASVMDGTYNIGEIGVVASAFNQPTEIAFSDAKVWTL